jgi:hypothetical protein
VNERPHGLSRLLLSKWPGLIGWMLHVVFMVVMAWALVRLSA